VVRLFLKGLSQDRGRIIEDVWGGTGNDNPGLIIEVKGLYRFAKDTLRGLRSCALSVGAIKVPVLSCGGSDPDLTVGTSAAVRGIISIDNEAHKATTSEM